MPVRFTFHEYRPGDSNPDRQVPGTCASASWARTACERLTGFEPATFDLASRRSDLLSYNRKEPFPGADPGGQSIPRTGDADPKGIECARPDLNRDAPRGALAPRTSAST